MKRVIIVLLIVLLVLTGSASASEIDLASMSFDELVELRDRINQQMRSIYPEYDYVLTEGNYFVGIDLPKGTVLFCRINGDEAPSDVISFIDENKEILNEAYTTPSYTRTRCTLEDGQEFVLLIGGPIGVKYLQD